MEELRRILHESRVPAIYVTHDQEEAFTLADRVLLLHDGAIVRSGTPEKVWSDPGSLWAAQFLDAGNVVAGVVRSEKIPFQVETPVGMFMVNCGEAPLWARGAHTHANGEEIFLLISRRGPHQVAEGMLGGVVTDVVFRPDGFKVQLENNLEFYLPDPPKVGMKIYLDIPEEGIKCLS